MMIHWIKRQLKRFWRWLLGATVVTTVALALIIPNGGLPDYYNLDVSKKEAPYGAWIDANTGEKRYYDEIGKFYDNTEEIETLQSEFKKKKKTEESISEESISSDSKHIIE